MEQHYYQKDLECISKDALKALQLERLCEQVAYIYDRVAPYRKKMDAAGLKPSDIRSLDDIRKLPFTEKTDLRDSYPFGMFAMPKEDLARIHASSGTTGKLTVVGYTDGDLDVWSDVMARSLACAGATKDSLVHICYGYGLFTGGLGAHDGATKLGATVVPASSGNTARQLMLMKDFGADILCCTPSYAMYIGEEFEKAGVKPNEIPLKSGIFGAEPWTEEMRMQIEKKLGIHAHDIYGLSEIIGPGVAVECSEKKGMHVWEDHFLVEVLDLETHMPVEDGQRGELVITTLSKKGMPLLRYRTRDICTLNHSPCACGRTHVRMSKVLGRTDDMLIIRGVNVFPSQIESVLLNIGHGVTPNYQIIVDRVNNADTIEVQIELDASLFSDTIGNIQKFSKHIEHELHNVLGLSAAVKLVELGSIARSEGKAKRVIDRRNIQ